jgi:hypothetical protein
LIHALRRTRVPLIDVDFRGPRGASVSRSGMRILPEPCASAAPIREDTTVTISDPDTWRIGEVTVRRVGFGAMRSTGSAAFHDRHAVPVDRSSSIAVLRRALELGVNHIDTAAFYFAPLRSANELINSALAPYPEDLLIATKVGPAGIPAAMGTRLGRSSCGGRSRRTCVSSAATTSTWFTCAGWARNRLPSTSAR